MNSTVWSVLTQIVRQMVDERSLTVRLNNDNDLGLNKPGRVTAWNELQSDEILVRGFFDWTTDCFFSQHSF